MTSTAEHTSATLGVFIRSATVKDGFGGVSDMTLWRWIKYRGFPKPTKLNGRNYWNPSDIDQWVLDRAT